MTHDVFVRELSFALQPTDHFSGLPVPEELAVSLDTPDPAVVAPVGGIRHADGSYRITVSDGSTSTGTWKAEGTKLCYTRIDPAPAAGDPNPLCVEGLDGHKAGDRWMATGHHGLPMTMSVVSGQ